MDNILRKLLPFLLVLPPWQALADTIVVIGHPALPKLDVITIQRIFMGRIIEVDGITVSVVNATPANPARGHFLSAYLDQDENQYVAYWTVRKFIGKGNPPRELATSTDIINYVQSRPGAIGYIYAADFRPGVNVLNRK